MKVRQLIRDYLSSCRLPNLASVWSQVILGACLIFFFNDKDYQFATIYELDINQLIITGVMVSLLYLYGCLSGDWYDVNWDKQHQPNRPIPSGRIPRKNIGLLALSCLSGAGYLATYLPSRTLPWVLALAVVVSLYTLFHKRNFAARVILMAACRGLIIPVTVLVHVNIDAFWASIIGFSSFSLFFYILSFMTSSKKKLSRGLLGFSVILQLIIANIYLIEHAWADLAIWAVVIILTGLAIWIHRAIGKPQGRFIKRSLAWMPVFDLGVAVSVALVSGYYGLVAVPFIAVALWYTLSKLADAD